MSVAERRRAVIDASAALRVATSSAGFAGLSGLELSAPPLFWSEVHSALHQVAFRRELSADLVDHALRMLATAPIERVDLPDLQRAAWRLADQLGWAKTYDAEYVALAIHLRAPILTRDRRLERGGARRFVEILGPSDI